MAGDETKAYKILEPKSEYMFEAGHPDIGMILLMQSPTYDPKTERFSTRRRNIREMVADLLDDGIWFPLDQYNAKKIDMLLLQNFAKSDKGKTLSIDGTLDTIDQTLFEGTASGYGYFADNTLVYLESYDQTSRHHGCLWISKEHHVIARFLAPPGKTVIESLYAIEKYAAQEHRVVPMELTGGWLAYEHSSQAITSTPNAFAAILSRWYFTNEQIDKTTSSIGETFNCFISDEYVLEFSEIPKPGVKLAQFLITLSRRLWDEKTIGRIIQNYSFQNTVSLIAHGWNQVSYGARINYQGQQLRAVPMAHSGQWNELALLYATNAIPGIVKWFFGFNRDALSFTMYERAISTMPKKVDTDHYIAICKGLEKDTNARRQYTACGNFVLLFPPGYPLREAGIEGIAVAAMPTGLYFASLDSRGNRSPVGYWAENDPNLHFDGWTDANVGVTLYALWHDLSVAGETVFVHSNKGPRHTANVQPIRQPSKKVLQLPRHKTIYIGGDRMWGSDADHRQHMQAHRVVGHRRKLLSHQNRSDEAEENARKSGFILPDGYTYVKEHSRGLGETIDRETVAKAAGLNTVMVFLK